MTLTPLLPSCLEVEADADDNGVEAGGGAEGVEGEPDEGFGLGAAGAGEPVEGLAGFVECGVDDGDVVGGGEAACGERGEFGLNSCQCSSFWGTKSARHLISLTAQASRILRLN